MKVTAVAIGDSITYGYPYRPEYSWTALAARELGITILNKGVCGETTGDMRARFAQDVLPHRPQLVIIMGGTNDAFLHIRPQEVADNLAGMVQAAREAGIVPVLGMPIPSNYPEDEVMLDQYRQWLREYAAREKVALIDFYSPMLAPGGAALREGLHVDGVHPSEAGYQVMARAAVDALRPVVGNNRQVDYTR